MKAIFYFKDMDYKISQIARRFPKLEPNESSSSHIFICSNFHKDLEMPTVKEEIKKFSERYLQRLSNHSNILAINLLDDSEELQRLKRFHVLYLPFRN